MSFHGATLSKWRNEINDFRLDFRSPGVECRGCQDYLWLVRSVLPNLRLGQYYGQLLN